jgi:hypothetical protein
MKNDMGIERVRVVAVYRVVFLGLTVLLAHY